MNIARLYVAQHSASNNKAIHLCITMCAQNFNCKLHFFFDQGLSSK